MSSKYNSTYSYFSDFYPQSTCVCNTGSNITSAEDIKPLCIVQEILSYSQCWIIYLFYILCRSGSSAHDPNPCSQSFIPGREPFFCIMKHNLEQLKAKCMDRDRSLISFKVEDIRRILETLCELQFRYKCRARCFLVQEVGKLVRWLGFNIMG